jgi:hypothetical protein
MTAAHTPGPWKCGPDLTVVHEHSGVIARLASTRGKFEWEAANARLIAAAPDLLAALTDLLAMCERQADFNDDGDGGMFARSNAAIAKATGSAA